MNKKSTYMGTLVVDLDGTLLRSDLGYESFWSALGQDWRSPVKAGAARLKSKAGMKAYLAQTADLDVTRLPYNDAVITHIRDWRKKGGRTALVTSSDQSLAQKIAGHLELFDEVHGSDGTVTLAGETKLTRLSDSIGKDGFQYMGHSAADLPIWKDADQALLVNASAALSTRVNTLGVPVEIVANTPVSLTPYIKALRPHQWLKNMLVFLPVLTAHLLTGANLLLSLLAFVAFSLIASSVYVLNDLLDLRADRQHPRKRKRPFAAGDIPISHGTWMAGGLLASGALLSLFLGPAFALAMLVYYLATLAYSINLKRRAIVDICVLAGLYTMRIVAGGAATGISLSIWLLTFSIFFFFALAAIKRQAELVDMAERDQLNVSGRGYHVDDLQIISMMAIGAGYVSILIMVLYVNSPAVAELYSTPTVLWGISCVLLYWISRLVLVTHRGHMHDDPVIYAAKDRMSQICAIIIFVLAILATVL